MGEPKIMAIQKVNLRQVFLRVLLKYGIRPHDTEVDHGHQGLRLLDIQGKGFFRCMACSRSWERYFSWLTFDLEKLEVKKFWVLKCDRPCMTDCYPRFSSDELKKMVEIAVQLYKGCYESRRRPPYTAKNMPHNPSLCEKCEWGQTFCWEEDLR